MWATRNALLERPHDFRQCQARDGPRYCAYPAYRSLIDLREPPMAGVRRALAPGRWPADVQVSQRSGLAVDSAGAVAEVGTIR